jgi:hypothetical protein
MLGFLIADYIAHMEHHLRAMRLWLGIPGETGVATGMVNRIGQAGV